MAVGAVVSSSRKAPPSSTGLGAPSSRRRLCRAEEVSGFTAMRAFWVRRGGVPPPKRLLRSMTALHAHVRFGALGLGRFRAWAQRRDDAARAA